MKVGRHVKLLEDKNVRRWYENISRGSYTTADVYMRKLGEFCSSNDLTPKKLARMSERKLFDLLVDNVSRMEKEGKAGSYIETIIKAVRSWSVYNGKEVRGRVKIRGARDTPSLKREKVPSQDELRRILLSGDTRARIACALVAQSGLRIEVLGNYRGDDGLTVGDLPEMEIKGDSVEFKKVPTLVAVRKELSKARHMYFSFLSEEGCEYLKGYLEERIRGGEQITSDTPIITPKVRTKPFITTINVGDIMRKAIRAAGFPWRPYVLRSYFDTELMLAESKGLVLRDYRTFWMGHKGDIENRYTTNKQKLPGQVVEDMREAYRRSQQFLETIEMERTSEEKIKEEFRKQLLVVAGFKQEEMEKIDVMSKSDEEFQSMVREKLLGAMANNGARQKVIDLDEVEKHVAMGWEFVAQLSNDKAIMKIPS